MSLFQVFAQMLEYPAVSTLEALSGCAVSLAEECPDAAAALREFMAAASGKNLGAMQELYISAFDLRPDCTPNLGYHLFGDDSRRGVFLAELKERMERAGVAVGVELPDYLPLILSYLDVAEEERPVLIEDCLLPALARMAEILNGTGNPYQNVVRALLLWLRLQHELYAARADAVEV